MAKVSIILAAYNVENYIREALDSATGQTMRDIEIICVDDGSTDGTAEILKEYAAKDSRVRVIRHAENQGPFAARHTGIMAAAGQYVLFLDGDDSYVPHACERLYGEIVARNLDVLDCGAAMRVSESNSMDEKTLAERALFFSHAPQTIPENREELLRACFVEKDIRWAMWGKMCALDLVKKAYASFNGERIMMAEDALVMFMVFFYAQGYGYLDECLYRYRFGSGVSTNDMPPTVQRLEDFATQCQIYGLLCKWLTPAQREKAGVTEALEALRANLQNNILYFLQLTSVENAPAFLHAVLQYCTLEEFICDLAETITRLRFTQTYEIALRLRDCEELFPRKKAIKTVASFYNRLVNGGVERVMTLLAPIWQNAGYQVVIITEQDPDPLDFSLPEGVQRVIIPEERNSKGRMMAWQRIIREYQIDAVVYHAWESDGRILDALAIKSQRVPFILHTHGSSATDFYSIFNTPVQQEATDALSDVVVALSEVDQAWWQALGYRSICVSNPLTYRPQDVQPSALQGQDVLWLARLSYEKQYMDAFEIASLVHQKIPGFRLHVVGGAGWDKDFERIQNYLAENKMTSYVILHGFQTDVEKYFQRASAMLLTSKFEGCPMVVMESKAFGVPLVTYEIPNVSAIRKEEGMFVVPQRDRQAAADRIVQLLENEDLRRQMGGQARRSAEEIERFDFGAQWKMIFDLAAAPRELHQPLYRQPPMTTALCIAMRGIQMGERTGQQINQQTIQQTIQQVTQQVTWQVTQQVTWQVTQEVTQEVTQQVTRQMTQEMNRQINQLNDYYQKKEKREREDMAEYCHQIESQNAQYAVMVQELQNSKAYRIGMLLTAFPRRLKDLFKAWMKR